MATYIQTRFGTVKMAEPKKQLQNNVESLLWGYENGMNDCGEEEYPPMTLDEAFDYCVPSIYNELNTGHGHTVYGNGICDNLKFLGNDYIKSVIKEVGEDCGVIIA